MYDLDSRTKNEESDEDQTGEKLIKAAFGAFCTAGIFATISIVFYFRYRDNDCNVDIPGTKIDILTWHLIYAIALITIAILTLGAACVYYCCSGLEKVFKCISGLIGSFLFVWWIILWIAAPNVLPECKNTDAQPLYDYSFWGILILPFLTIGIVCVCAGCLYKCVNSFISKDLD